MAEQNANNVAITGGAINGTTVGATTASTGAFTTLSASSTVSGTGFGTYLASPPAIGGTTAAAGTFTTLIGGSGSANYEQITGGATTKAVQFQTLGSDTNISLAIQPKGTGAIDLAAGSSGVNISNGGTVTAITRTASGSAYTTPPTWSASAPTIAGGVAASGTTSLQLGSTPTVISGGTGYTVGDTLTFVGGTFTTVATVVVSTVSSGVITAVTNSATGVYSVIPSNPISITGGTGTGATFNASWGIAPTLAIGTAGSGYVEQPTVTFSGGGGSGAAAYATVGGTPKIQTLGTNLDFYTPGGQAFRVSDGSATATPVTWVEVRTNGTTANIGSGGTSNPFLINTNGNIFTVRSGAMGSVGLEQFRVSNIASAVNYVNITGAATGAAPVISAQGSDAAVGLTFNTKSTGVHTFQTNGTTRLLINSGGTVQLGYANAVPCFTAAGAASQVNGLQVAGSVAGSSPVLSTTGTDADIDLTLTPKGAGRVNITTSIKPKVNSAASVTSPLAWNSTSYDEYALTALANALTISADANTAPADGQRMMFRFKDNGTAQALTWTTGSARAFRVVGVMLPTATVANKLLYVGCIYNAADSRWDAIAVGQEA
jgi:hypothetical protein